MFLYIIVVLHNRVGCASALPRFCGGGRIPAYRKERIRPEGPRCSDSHWVTESWIDSFALISGCAQLCR